MRTMSGGFCLHYDCYDCSNRNSFGYCKTTVCINEHYQQEQWGSLLTTNKSESVVIKPQTNADRIRAMSDEELAKEMSVRLSEDCLMCPVLKNDCPVWESKDIECETAMLEWLRKESEDDE